MVKRLFETQELHVRFLHSPPLVGVHVCDVERSVLSLAPAQNTITLLQGGVMQHAALIPLKSGIKSSPAPISRSLV